MFDDGSSTITFWPTSYDMSAEDFTEPRFSATGAVIASASEGGLPVQRTRRIGLVRTTAEQATLLTFLRDNDGAAFLFTDDVGRIWNVHWLGGLESGEVANADDGNGWHQTTVDLLLDSVSSDAGLEAYANADVSQMSVLKSGGSTLYFPLAYRPPLGRGDRPTAWKTLSHSGLAVDAGRYTARRSHTMEFSGLSRAFIRALEDWYVDTIQGAANPFTLAHFRDGSTAFRWTDGFHFAQDDALRYGGTIAVLQDI